MESGQREVTDADGMTWTCIQAFAGLGNDPDKQAAAQVGDAGEVQVVCTPSGGARSRRVVLPSDWATMEDGALLAVIAAKGGG